MSFFIEYFFLYLLIAVVNIMPGFMPPTWSILAFFSIQNNLSLYPLILVGVAGATSGRIGLYFLAKYFGKKFLTKKSLNNFNDLGCYLNLNKKSIITVVLAYAFIPLPSNQLFITAGLAGVRLGILAFSFAFGRLISYTSMVLISNSFFTWFYKNIGFTHSKPMSFFLELAGFFLIYLIGRINWKKVIGNRNKI